MFVTMIDRDRGNEGELDEPPVREIRPANGSRKVGQLFQILNDAPMIKL